MRPISKSPLSHVRPGRGVTQAADDARNAAAVIEKKRLRSLCLARRAGLTDSERSVADDAMCEKLFSSELWKTAELVCLYVPMRGEPDVLPIWKRAAALGRQVALPVCGVARRLSFRLMPDYGAGYLRPGPHGTQEPTEDCPLVSTERLAGALMLVPGLTFDKDGYRLGYGGGYYDTLLRDLAVRCIQMVTIGITYDCCLASSLPRQTHDIPVDYILTEGRFTPTHARRDIFSDRCGR